MTVNSTKPAIIVNQETGEFMGQLPGDEILDESEAIPMNAKFSKSVVAYRDTSFPDNQLPLHLAMLESMGLSDEENLTLIEAWDTCATMTLKEFVAEVPGKNVQVLGVRIYEQGPYKAKGSQAPMPGYYAPQLLVINPETKKRLRVRTSAPLISQILFYTGRKYGWWIFDEPLTYQFRLDKEGRLQMSHVEKAGEESIEQKLSKISRKGAK